MFGTATVAVPDDGLAGVQFVTDAKHVVDGADAVEEERELELFAEGYFLAEDLELQGVGGVAEAVETAFANGEEGGGVAATKLQPTRRCG